jgi:hypothetical protein
MPEREELMSEIRSFYRTNSGMDDVGDLGAAVSNSSLRVGFDSL